MAKHTVDWRPNLGKCHKDIRYLRFWPQPPVKLLDDEGSGIMTECLVLLTFKVSAGDVGKHRKVLLLQCLLSSNEM